MHEALARFMYDLVADDYEAVDEFREQMWDEVRDFWLGQATAILDFIDLHK